jgi:hypothetical protein
MWVVVSESLATTDSMRSLCAMVVVVDDVGVCDNGAAVLNVSSSRGELQLVARMTMGTQERKLRIKVLDMSASADAGITNSDVDELCMWILPKICKFQKLTIGI